ncbi:MAG: NAD(P)-binding domain-containing protein, partial [Xanthomonadales bacterium]|nr:NAD(P)-binding domain-containing protein [Xanthomonadales bacterium]
MQIAILGAGNVGLALARALTRRGSVVTLGVPEPAKYEGAVAALGPLARLKPTAEAIAGAELVILAVPHAAVADIAGSRSDWGGRILVDATNPLAPGLAGLTVGTTTSAAEQLASQAVGARVVKAFNTTGAENMADSAYAGGLPLMPVCGDDADARQRVLRDGLDPPRLSSGRWPSLRLLDAAALSRCAVGFAMRTRATRALGSPKRRRGRLAPPPSSISPTRGGLLHREAAVLQQRADTGLGAAEANVGLHRFQRAARAVDVLRQPLGQRRVEDVTAFLEGGEAVGIQHLAPHVAVVAGRVATGEDMREVRAAMAHHHLRQHAVAGERLLLEAGRVDAGGLLGREHVEGLVDQRRGEELHR